MQRKGKPQRTSTEGCAGSVWLRRSLCHSHCACVTQPGSLTLIVNPLQGLANVIWLGQPQHSLWAFALLWIEGRTSPSTKANAARSACSRAEVSSCVSQINPRISRLMQYVSNRAAPH